MHASDPQPRSRSASTSKRSNDSGTRISRPITRGLQPCSREQPEPYPPVTSSKPLAALPGVPTLASYYPGFNTSLWHGYLTMQDDFEKYAKLVKSSGAKAD
jgi:hypothetical protein